MNFKESFNKVALTDETKDALRKHLALKGRTDEACKTPERMMDKDVQFLSPIDPDFSGTSFGKLEIPAQSIKNANYMFAGIRADGLPKERALHDTAMAINKTALRSAMAGYALGVDTTEQAEESSVDLEK